LTATFRGASYRFGSEANRARAEEAWPAIKDKPASSS
jgi:hypothetical protein